MNAHAIVSGYKAARQRIETAARARAIVDPEAISRRRDDFPKAVILDERDEELAERRRQKAAEAKAAEAAARKAAEEAAALVAAPPEEDLFTALLASVEILDADAPVVRPRCADIIRAASIVYRMSGREIISARRNQATAIARQVAMYVCKTETLHSLPEIGRRFGGRDHTTVLHAVRKIAALIPSDPEIAKGAAAVRRLAVGIASGNPDIRARISERKGVVG